MHVKHSNNIIHTNIYVYVSNHTIRVAYSFATDERYDLIVRVPKKCAIVKVTRQALAERATKPNEYN